jgi:hypothetical protein
MCVAKGHVRFTLNSDRESGLRQPVMAALPQKADMCSAPAHVRFGPIADMRPLRLFNYVGNSIARRYEHDLIFGDEEFECFDLRDFLDNQRRKAM